MSAPAAVFGQAQIGGAPRAALGVGAQSLEALEEFGAGGVGVQRADGHGADRPRSRRA